MEVRSFEGSDLRSVKTPEDRSGSRQAYVTRREEEEKRRAERVCGRDIATWAKRAITIQQVGVGA